MNKRNFLSPDEELDGTEDSDIDADEEDGREISSILVSKFVRMWPREIFDAVAEAENGQKINRKTIASVSEVLNKHGVYILYRDDTPFYIGQAKSRSLGRRLRAHATRPNARRYLFWNYFSAYVIEDPKHIDEVEAILIAAMPFIVTNSAIPKLEREKMDRSTVRLVNRLRRQKLNMEI
jgi:hypothetical protein